MIFFVAIVVLLFLTMICAGCGFRIRNQANLAMASIKKKMERLKKKTELKEI